MRLRTPWAVTLLALGGAWLIRLWSGTLHYRIFFAEGVRHPADFRKSRFIYAFWHESILFPAAFRTRIHVLISQHSDGEFIARVCRFLGFQTARGSSTRGGSAGLLELVRCSRHTHLGVTPDGPRGPRRQVQPGVIYLASLTGLPVVAFGVGYAAAWRARSWDCFAVPKPCSLAACVVAPALYVPPRLDRAGLERYRNLLEERLLRATRAAERWAQGGRRPTPDEQWDSEGERKVSA
jgi:lysophospholipid acyltransferase (LPLAT)-like uncharacterized protein